VAVWTRMAQRAVRLRADLALGVLDAILLAAAYTLTLLLRFDGSVPDAHWRDFGRFLPVAVFVGLAANVLWGLYGQVWRHASMQEARRLLASGLTAVVVLLALELFKPDRTAPISVALLGTGVGTFFCAAVRFQSRLFAFHRNEVGAGGMRVVLVGGRDKAATLLREMQRHPQMGFTPVGIVDPDPRLHGRSVGGLRVAGGVDALPAVARVEGAHLAVLAMSSVDQATIREVAALAEQAGIGLKIAPDIGDRMHAGVSMRDIRDVQIDDLLGRSEVTTDLDAVTALLRGRRVLITGAGGSIGSEIARQVSACQPAELLLLDHDETHLHDAVTTLSGPATSILADVRDPGLVRRVIERHRPEVVFHAAAHKHVPLLEAHPCEAAYTNVLGTQNLLSACRDAGVERLVFISTDKAVEPSSVMGATKRIGERLLQSEAPIGAHWCAVRFGNVLGSRGSVVPTFMRQIEAGGPVTVTDPRMTRYFMSIEEAVQLVLQAATLATRGDIFVLDMGEPVRIMELAERMIRLSGRRVGADIAIEITGVRPGEKLVEELHHEAEHLTPTVHPSINRYSAVEGDPGPSSNLIDGLRHLVAAMQDEAVRGLVFDLAAKQPEPLGPDTRPSRAS
jgi:FlaA1/EpsC-like NDP-sugar epimerase